MIRSSRYVVIAALVILIAGAGVFAFAQGPAGRGHGPGGPGGPGGAGIGIALGALNLTEAQREQVRQITQQHREQARGTFERLRVAQDARNQAVQAVPFDEGRIRAAMQQLAEIETELAVMQARIHNDVFALLTPEQQAQAQKLRAEREARMKERQGRALQRRQQHSHPRPQA